MFIQKDDPHINPSYILSPPPISGRLEPAVELCVYIKMWGGGREVRMPRLNKSREYDYVALE